MGAYDEVEQDIDVIDKDLGPTVGEILADGLPDGSESDWGYDTQLVRDIAKACRDWEERRAKQKKTN